MLIIPRAEADLIAFKRRAGERPGSIVATLDWPRAIVAVDVHLLVRIGIFLVEIEKNGRPGDGLAGIIHDRSVNSCALFHRHGVRRWNVAAAEAQVIG